ncbi:thermostable monoacylglycerol lipase [Sideroxyarcus emersonii]|uniref:Thermostable monoacylglycerol lipase n=1 Tax=Sideroxyarcus emersonii TaxID=2764705 RepID=A0AAN1X8D3_9PROT|nr:alpha/beta fold hydrolase [Sideroxyarcus emersonii]BCK86584.1 thermostable monoacylglycerol lipase [Sideroxyarcus emersonii]
MRPVTLAGGENAVLLIHGLQSSPAELLPLAKRLQQAGYTVHLPHIPGYGFEHGDTPRSVTHWQDWHAKALQEFRALQQQYKTVSVGGLCIGGTLSLSIAAELGDEVTALTLLSTTLWYDGWAMPWYRPFRYLGYIWPIRYWYTYKEREPFGLKNEQLRRWVAREMAHKDASMVGASRLNLPAIQEAERMIAVVKKTMSRITAPAIVIHAVEDEVASPRSARYIARHIGSRTVESVMLHNSYHMITVDNDRDQVAADTIRFFDHARSLRAPG